MEFPRQVQKLARGVAGQGRTRQGRARMQQERAGRQAGRHYEGGGEGGARNVSYTLYPAALGSHNGQSLMKAVRSEVSLRPYKGM